MKLPTSCTLVLAVICLLATLAGQAFAADRVKIANGIVEIAAPPVAGVRAFKGIPFAQPPVGDLRWREPQPPRNWTGVRNADKFGPDCMQRAGGDYWFRGDGMSEDCLYLNVWTPAKSGGAKLPVLVYIFGGGFQNGSGSEPRYDGGNMAGKGIVAVAVNYRTNVFGFFSHPELTQESPHHASGNQGLLDQVAALQWVRKNIAAFGGDPKTVTIAGESAGSISVSALMASPLSRNLIAGAIGESGAMLGSTMPPKPLADAEQDGAKFAAAAGAANLAALRAMAAKQIEDGAAGGGGLRFSTSLDGYFLAKTLGEIFAAGEQAKVPLLAGTNSQEQGAQSVLGNNDPTPENLAAAIRRLYPDHPDDIVKAYAATTQDEVLDAATHLASARFIAHGTWKWTELQAKTGGKPVYRYYYTRIRPRFIGNAAFPAQTNAAPGAGRGGANAAARGGEAPAPSANAPPARGGAAAAGRRGARAAGPGGRGGPAAAARGAAHSAEIPYAMGNLDLDDRYAWEPADHKVSGTMQAYFLNFIKTGNPNGQGLPDWPTYSPGTNYQRMRIDVESAAEPEPHRDRYVALDAIYSK